jgi:hypothetical protein
MAMRHVVQSPTAARVRMRNICSIRQFGMQGLAVWEAGDLDDPDAPRICVRVVIGVAHILSGEQLLSPLNVILSRPPQLNGSETE